MNNDMARRFASVQCYWQRFITLISIKAIVIQYTAFWRIKQETLNFFFQNMLIWGVAGCIFDRFRFLLSGHFLLWAILCDKVPHCGLSVFIRRYDQTITPIWLTKAFTLKCDDEAKEKEEIAPSFHRRSWFEETRSNLKCYGGICSSPSVTLLSKE